MDLSFGQQWLLTSKKKNPRHHNLTNVNEHTTAKGNESEFIKPLDVAINF